MFYNYFITHYPGTIIFSFVLGVDEDNFQCEYPAATRDSGYQAQDKMQPFVWHQCRDLGKLSLCPPCCVS